MECNRNIKIFLTIICCLAVMSALLSGCDHKTDRKMEEIEAVLDNDLDSTTILPAIRSLDSIPVETLNKRQRALHALLTVQSRHKQHLPLATDSLAFYEAAYFDGSSDTRHRMKWHFYRGATRLQLEDYRGAIFDALHAIRLSASLPDTLFMAKSEELLADIYSATFNSELAIKHQRESAKLYNRIGRERNLLFTYIDICTELEFIGQYNESIRLCDTILQLASPSDSAILGNTYAHLATAYSRKGNLTEARKANIMSTKYYGTNLENLAGLSFLADCYTLTNDADSVEKYVEACNQLAAYHQDVTHFANLKWLAAYHKDYESAYHYADSVAFLINNTAKNILNRQGVFAQADFYLWQLDEEKDKARTKTTWLSVFIFCLIICLGVGWICYRKRQKRLQNQIAQKLSEISQLRDDIFRLDKDLLNAKSDRSNYTNLKELIQKSFAAFDAVTSSYYANTFIRKKSTDAIQKDIDYLKDDGFLTILVDYANSEYSDVITKLRVAFPKMKQMTAYLVALRVSGFSVQSICVLLEISPSNYYTRLHRLREQISNLPDPDKTFFMNIVG